MHESTLSDSILNSRPEAAVDDDAAAAKSPLVPPIGGESVLLLASFAEESTVVPLAAPVRCCCCCDCSCDDTDGPAVPPVAATWLDLFPRSLAQLNLSPQFPFLDFPPPPLLAPLPPDPDLPVWLLQVALRQHLQERDFLPADVSELSSVDAADIEDDVVVVVGVVGSRQQEADEEPVVFGGEAVSAVTFGLRVAAAAAAGPGAAAVALVDSL